MFQLVAPKPEAVALASVRQKIHFLPALTWDHEPSKPYVCFPVNAWFEIDAGDSTPLSEAHNCNQR